MNESRLSANAKKVDDMSALAKQAPAYGLHKPSGQARVKLYGKYRYLGRHGSQESIENYNTAIQEWLAKHPEAEPPEPIEKQIAKLPRKMPRTRRRDLKPDMRGNFRPNVGRYRADDGIIRPKKFALGSDRIEAEKRYDQIRAIYETVKAECWPSELLELADLIARGGKAKPAVSNSPPVNGTPHFIVVNGTKYEIAESTAPATPDDLTLLQFFERSYLTEKELSSNTAEQYRITIGAFEKWHGGALRLRELSDELVNSWLIAQNGTRAPKTVKNRRQGILTLWRYAVECGLLDAPPLRVRKVKCPRRLPEAWRVNDVRRMIEASDRHSRYYPNGLRIGAYWACFVRVCFDTGLRLGDMLALPLGTPQEFRVMQEKTLDEITLRLNDSTMKAIAEIRTPERDLLFDWPLCREAFWVHWAKYVLKSAGIEPHKRNGPQKLRRTAASYVEQARAGSASVLLGHRTPTMARQHYIDPSIANPEPISPPDLAEL